MKKYFILAAIIVIAFLSFLYVRENKNKQGQVAGISIVQDNSKLTISSQQNLSAAPAAQTAKQTLCKAGAFTEPSAQAVSYGKQIAKDPYVQYLRTAIDGYVNKSYPVCQNDNCYTGLVNGKHYQDAAYSTDLPQLDPDYLKSQMFILQADPAPTGGESIVLMFKDRPDNIFYAWVYHYHGTGGTGYDLRALAPYDMSQTDMTLEQTQQDYVNEICSDNVGI